MWNICEMEIKKLLNLDKIFNFRFSEKVYWAVMQVPSRQIVKDIDYYFFNHALLYVDASVRGRWSIDLFRKTDICSNERESGLDMKRFIIF